MKTFRTVGSGSTQTIEPIENNKIPVYETKTAAETDLANLEVGQIIATKDEGNELSNPVDVVQDGNMHAVTSNAVAASINELQPVNSVSSGNMKSVTSNAVYDSISGLKPVNVVEGGNMSAVTSNAVYNYLSSSNNDIEVITPEIGSIYYASISLKVTRFEHVVNINCYIIFDNTTDISEVIIANGLPVPISIADSGRFYISTNVDNISCYLEKNSSNNLARLRFDNTGISVSSGSIILFSSFYFV